MLANGTLTNTAQLNASGAGNALDNENATNTGAIEVSGELLLDQGTAVDNTNGTVTVDNTGTLTLNDASIDHGAVTDNGTIDLTGAGVLANGTLTNTGQLNASGTGNALDNENGDQYRDDRCERRAAARSGHRSRQHQRHRAGRCELAR